MGDQHNSLYKIERVINCSDIRHIYSLADKHASLKRKQIIEQYENLGNLQAPSTQQKLSELRTKLNYYYEDITKQHDLSTSNMILVFSRPESRDAFFYHSRNSWYGWIQDQRYRKYRGTRIEIRLPGVPKVIKWHNYGYTTTNRYLRLSLTWLLTLCLLVGSFWINKVLTELMVLL